MLLTLGALLLIPPALAWACNPQAHINLSTTSLQPGQSYTIYGSYFPGGKTITIATPTGTVTATTNAGGAFAVTETAPTAPGNYVVNAAKTTGGTAPASFSVGSAAATSAPTSVASGSVPSASPSSSKTPAFSTPAVHASTVPVTHHHAAAATTAPASSSTAVVPATVAPVSAAPVVPAAPVATATPAAGAVHHAAARTSHVAKSAAPATSQLAATSNLWSGFASGKGASLSSGGAMSSGGTSSALTIGIAVLAIGLIALVGGLSAAEVRRRRLSAR